MSIYDTTHNNQTSNKNNSRNKFQLMTKCKQYKNKRIKLDVIQEVKRDLSQTILWRSKRGPRFVDRSKQTNEHNSMPIAGRLMRVYNTWPYRSGVAEYFYIDRRNRKLPRK